MKSRAFAALCALGMAAALSGCASGQTWQVVEVYTDPSVPGALPDRATFRVRGSTFEGTTPCARVEGSFSLNDATLTLTTAHQTPLPNDADTCVGAGRYTHNQLMSVATEGAVFEVKETSASERLLVLSGHDEGAVLDPPSIRVLRERP